MSGIRGSGGYLDTFREEIQNYMPSVFPRFQTFSHNHALSLYCRFHKAKLLIKTGWAGVIPIRARIFYVYISLNRREALRDSISNHTFQKRRRYTLLSIIWCDGKAYDRQRVQSSPNSLTILSIYSELIMTALQ